MATTRTTMEAASAACCGNCGKTSDLMQCKKCKSVSYCSAECQRLDWKTHKPKCLRKESAGSPCDSCHGTEQHVNSCCLECGHLLCKVCLASMESATSAAGAFPKCPTCQQPRRFVAGHIVLNKLKKIIKDSPRDPRKPHWLVQLGSAYRLVGQGPNGMIQAKQYYLRAGEMGLAEGYHFLGKMCFGQRDWQQAKVYFIKAADMHCGNSIFKLAQEAELGCFMGAIGFDTQEIIVPENERHAPNLPEALRLYREGAKLGHPPCYVGLGKCYCNGTGTEINYAKAAKWFEKALELKDDQATRNLLVHLRTLQR